MQDLTPGIDIRGFIQGEIPLLTAFGLKVIGAIILWVIGGS